MYLEKMESLSSLKTIKRHYKKDSRFVNDLYTLTYDDDESLDTVQLISSVYNRKEALEVSSYIMKVGTNKTLLTSTFISKDFEQCNKKAINVHLSAKITCFAIKFVIR